VFLRSGPGRVLLVENMLLSCRVFARGIEQACLSAVLGAAREAGYAAVRGEYRPTAKNAKVRDLYPHYGFGPAEPGEDGAARHVHDLASVVEPPGHLALTAGEGLVPPPLTT
jgi:predicted enzyme involved in methoxymalonyl-ACP biosynthesis